MAQVFTQALGGDPGGYVDPYAAAIEEARKRIAQPVAPMHSPEEIAQRRATNQRQYQLGILGQLTGDEGLANVGGMVFRQALAQRTPTISERGTADPLSGEFTYNPQYLREREEAGLSGLETKSAQARATWDAARQRAAERAQDREEARAFRLSLRGAGGGGAGVGVAATPFGVDEQGNTVLRPTKGGQLFKYGPDGTPVPHTGPVLQKPSSAQPSEDERKAAGWLQQAEKGWADIQKVLQEDPSAAQVPLWERAVGAIPGVGEDTANVLRSQHRQRFRQASKQLSESMLRAATGAGYNMLEAKDAVESLTPVYGEAPETTQQKMEGIPLFLKGLRARAGRAALPPVDATTGGASGGWDAPTAAPPAAPAGAGNLSAQEQSELDALRKRFNR